MRVRLQAPTTTHPGPTAATSKAVGAAQTAQRHSDWAPARRSNAASAWLAGVGPGVEHRVVGRVLLRPTAPQDAAQTPIPTARRARCSKRGTASDLRCKTMCTIQWRCPGRARMLPRTVWPSGASWPTMPGKEAVREGPDIWCYIKEGTWPLVEVSRLCQPCHALNASSPACQRCLVKRQKGWWASGT